MAGGTKLSCVAALLLAGCAGKEGDLTIRSIPASPSMAAKPVPARIAEARGHFALGNVALALEGFRKAQRDDPNSTDALLGIAACYDRMGRFELSRRYYESALAIAPADPALLEALARSLDGQGRPADAAEVRQEIADLRPVNAPVFRPPAPIAVAAVPVQKAAPVGAAAPAASVTVALAPPAAPVTVPHTPPAASVTVALPPAKPIEAGTAAAVEPRAAIAAPTPLPKSVAIADTQTRASGIGVVRHGPRLERLSLAEVALVTSVPTRWRGEIVRQASTSTTVRFVPLRTASREVEVRLLNAARHQGLAARTRAAMNGQGWKRVLIGDALKVRQRSLVLYSAATSAAAKKLAAQFGFAIAKEARPGQITVLLGRDSIGPAHKRS